ncbi:hypothetical protein [Heyndrickxia coagulans]|uniref:hypothetical protein n=1 Tax=Heyndrickxia coagulans TaxID=1398 RepID=UPI0018A7C0F6|nr:hypothetical protein [Heyndrickxia coagulans]MBF8418920.1 hypothetical protein [Heyndrickxia coagulans]
MKASEAKKLSMQFAPEKTQKIIKDINLRIATAATKGEYSTYVLFENLPSAGTITNHVVEHFESLGYKVDIHGDWDTIRVDFSWKNA